MIQNTLAEFRMGNSLNVEVKLEKSSPWGDRYASILIDIHDENGEDPDEVVESYEIDMESLIEFARS